MNQITVNTSHYTPSKIICIGRNYVDHIRELNNEIPTEPVYFLKPNSAISDRLSTCSKEEIHYEGEICLLIENRQISAIGFGLDLTKRQLQSELKTKGLPWERAKAFNQSALFSRFIPFSGQLSDYQMKLYINDQLTQHANYELMIHKPEQLLTDIDSHFAWQDGDILMTGTPKGVGKVNAGDVFKAEIYHLETVVIESCWRAD